MFNFFKSKIILEEYKGLDFIPFHQLKKENDGNEPYIKTVDIKIGTAYSFFKIKGEVYAIKPTDKKHPSKFLCVKVSNPITLRSAQGSITGNCAKGVQKEYIEFINRLNLTDLSEEEKFRHIVLNLDNLI